MSFNAELVADSVRQMGVVFTSEVSLFAERMAQLEQDVSELVAVVTKLCAQNNSFQEKVLKKVLSLR